MIQEVIKNISPFFILVIIGFLAGKTQLIKKSAADGMMSYIYFIAIPCLLFSSIAINNLAFDADSTKFLFAYFSCAFSVYWLSVIFAKFVLKLNPKERYVYGFGSTFSNLVLLGIPISIAVLGKSVSDQVLVITAFHALLLLTNSVILLEYCEKSNTDKFYKNILNACKRMLKNPLIVAVIAAFVWRATSIKAPEVMTVTLDLVSASLAPIALIALGHGMSHLGDEKGRITPALTIVFAKMLIMPLLVLFMMHFVLHLDPVFVTTGVFLASLPTGNNAYIIAYRYNALKKSSANAVLISTVISALSLPAVIILLRLYL